MFFNESPYSKNKRNRFERKPLEKPKMDLRPIDYMTDAELMNTPAGSKFTFDAESYINYALIGFQHILSRKVVMFEHSPVTRMNLNKLSWMMWRFCNIGFNSNDYDVPFTVAALQGYDSACLKTITRQLIEEGLRPADLKLQIPNFNHVDLIEVAPLKASLKLYGGRLHCERMQDLPYGIDKVLTEEEALHVKHYNVNDLDNTSLMAEELEEQLQLRVQMGEQYKQDLRSRSDAQIAEHVISAEVAKIIGKYPKRQTIEPGTRFKFIPPDYLKFKTEKMQKLFESILQMDFEISETGYVVMDGIQGLDLPIGDTIYRMGKGGLHSKEKIAAHVASNYTRLFDVDVESFYPRLILNSGFFPKNMGEAFRLVFEAIVERRVEAKRAAKAAKKAGDKAAAKAFQVIADSLKIVINGTFGKLGSKWSAMYSPNLLIQVTLTGQLVLLMLIEALELVGIPVVSANTDGLVIKANEDQMALMRSTVALWEAETGLKTEEAEYKALYSRDINNYMAIKTDGTVKGKGAYSNPWNDPATAIFRFHKNPQTTICIEAVSEFLTNGTPIDQTIYQCTDIRKFVSVRQVKGGAEKNGMFLGKAIRWYYAHNTPGEINYVGNGNKVPETWGAKPIMDLPSALPNDIDYDWYYNKAVDILHKIGYHKSANSNSLEIG